MNEPLLYTKDLHYSFKLNNRTPIRAVRGVELTIYRGEILGLVGESGCGKSTLARLLMGFYKPQRGVVAPSGVTRQLVFQDNTAALNPRFSVREVLEEPLLINGLAEGKRRRQEKLCELLSLVGLDEAMLTLYPHELSGGQRQRLAIARALALEPQLLIADEPLASLDVSVQAQIVNLLKGLQQSRGLSILFIAHDLNMVRYVSDRIAVMHHGRLVEIAAPAELFTAPVHPFTKQLVEGLPLLP